MKNGHLHSRKVLRAALLVLLLTLVGMTKANPVDMQTAREVAVKFVNANTRTPLRGAEDLQLVTTYRTESDDAAFHIFNTPNGFVIVAADDCATPILGYSNEGQFDTENIPIQLQDYLQGFVEQIQYGIENHIAAKENVVREWELVRTTGRLSNNRSDEVVEPLLTTKWDQHYPYNMYVPNGCPTGCTATAMAQIMKYWEWPVQGTGEHSYQWNGQTLSANFGETTYDWDNMLDYYSYQSTQEQNEAVATLMWHCGVSVNMYYAPGGSYGGCSPSALIDYFNYSDDMHEENRQNDETWMSLLKTDLNLGYPVFYVGYGSSGGHAFVCDGYDVNDRFHFNWGWGGEGGYFALNGIDYSNDNSAIFNIHPNTSITRQVTASASPSDGGLVTGTGMYDTGSICTLTATANEGYTFMYWTEDDEVVSTQAEYSFCVRKDRDLVAHFATPFHIGVTIVPGEGGTVSGEGEYTYGSTCTLTATANEGYDFICWRWANGNVVTTAPTCSLTVTEATTLTAVFAVSGGEQIPFADLNVKALCVANWDTNGDGELSYSEAAAVTDLGRVFYYKSTITSFEELQYFTGLTTIGDETFMGCRNLSGSLYIPNSVTIIGSYAFYDCCGLTGSLTIPNSVTSIGANAFYDCCGLTGSLIIPNSVTSIGNYAFSGCSGLTGSLIIPNSVTSIGNFAFSGCSSLTGSLTIPNSVTSIGYNAFSGCSGFNGDLNISNSVTEIGTQAFYNCRGFKGSLTIGNSVTTIGGYAFENCSGFTGDLNIPNSVTYIGNYAFYNCSGFTGNLTIGNSVATIYMETFRGCSGFTGNLTIGNSVTTIGYNAFFHCENLSSLTVLAEIPPTLGLQAFSGVNKGIPVYVPCESVGAYITANWGGFNSFYGMCGGTVAVSANPEEGGTVTGGGVFEAGESCTVTATANEGYVFALWTGRIQNSTNAEYTFYVPSDLELVAHFVPEANITFADSNVKAICVTNWDTNGDGELSYFEAARVTDLGEVFRGNTEITSFEELQYFISLSTIGNYAFDNCSSLTGELIIPNTVTSIGKFAFYGCSGLTSIEIPSFMTSIGSYAFSNCTGLTSIEIPSSMTSIGSYAFSNCTGLTSITVHAETPPTIYYFTFYNCPKSIPVYVPCGSMEAYQNAEGWNEFINMIGLCSGEVVVTTNPSQGGTVTGAGYYNSGDICVLTATANPGYGFANWTENGVLVSRDSVFSFYAHPATIVANFSSDSPIVFADANVKAICVVNWDTNGDGELSYAEAAAVTSLGEVFRNNSTITSFDELQFFIGLTSIDDYAFYYCNGLTSIEIPNFVTSIGSWAFSDCSGLASIEIPSSMTSIGSYAFSSCTGLTSIEIPSSMTSIGSYAFSNCTGLASITVHAETPPTIYYFTFRNCPKSIPVYVPCASLLAYQNALGWNQFTNIQEVCTQSQTITLSAGWNWYSTYIEQEGINGLEMLENSIGSAGIRIQGRSGHTDYFEYQGSGYWYGSLNAITNEQMYKIRTNAACNVVMTGPEALPSDHPITITNGWNWIGYPCSQSQSIEAALGGFTPQANDVIKSKDATTTYVSYGGYSLWYGQLTDFEPGKGYMYKSNSSMPKTLTFQTSRNGETVADNTHESKAFTPNHSNYADNMVVTAVIELDGTELRSENHELAAFVGDECRGSVKLMYVEPFDRYIAFLLVSGETGEDMRFVLTDGESMNWSDDQLTFTIDGMAGTVTEPATLHFGTTALQDYVNIFPNPSNGVFNIEGQNIRKVEVFNALGQPVYSKDTENGFMMIDLTNQVAGIYLIRVVTDNGILNRQVMKR